MKYSIQQLLKIHDFPYAFSEILDLSDYAKDVKDIISIDSVELTGQINQLDIETYEFNYHIKTKMVLECALTLDPVDYLFENDYSEIYSTTLNDDYFLIENNTIDTSIMCWTNILIDKPISVTRPDAYEVLKERGIVLNEEIPIEDGEEIISYSDGKEINDSDLEDL